MRSTAIQMVTKDEASKANVAHSLKCNMWELNPQLLAQKARSVATSQMSTLSCGLRRIMWTFGLVWANLEIASIHGKCISTLEKCIY